MLRLTIDLLPGGDTARQTRIATCDIWNRSALAPVSKYGVILRLTRACGCAELRSAEVVHRRSRGLTALLAKAFSTMAQQKVGRLVAEPGI